MKSSVLLMHIFLASLFVAGNAVCADMPKGKYLDGKDSKVGVILGHGAQGDADSEVVGPLRKALHRELGFHTLSLDMPKPERGRPVDPATFPDAYKRISHAVDFLRKEKKVERIYLMGYSMSSRTTTAFLVNHPNTGIVGFIGVGMLGGGKEPFNTNLNLRKVKVPVLDIYAEGDSDDAKFAAFRKAMVSDRFKQVPLSGAPHSYKGYDSHLAAAVISWLKDQEQKALAR